MGFSRTVAQAYVQTYSTTQLQTFLEAALESDRNSVDVSISCEGSSITIDKGNAMDLVETFMEALRIKAAKASGCDPSLHGESWAVSLDRSMHRIK